MNLSGARKGIHLVRWLIICGAILTDARARRGNQIGLGLAPTSPMGWANWHYYFCNYDDPTIADQADHPWLLLRHSRSGITMCDH